MSRLPAPPLLVITDRSLCTKPLAAVVEAVFRGGCRWLMLREKDLDADRLCVLGREIIAIAKPYNALISINGSVIEGADGIHLPQGVPIPEAFTGLIGVSAHNLDEAASAAELGADYVTLSPIFPTASKPGYGPALGADRFREIAAQIPIPVIALGGISRDNAAACMEAGAAGVAVMGGVMGADDPEDAVRGLLRSIDAPTARSPGGSRP